MITAPTWDVVEKKSLKCQMNLQSPKIRSSDCVRLTSQVSDLCLRYDIGVSHVQLACMPSPLTTMYIGCHFLHRFNQHTSGTLPFYLSPEV
jgi:hypothetical protein